MQEWKRSACRIRRRASDILESVAEIERVSLRILFVDVYSQIRVLPFHVIEQARANATAKVTGIDKQHLDLLHARR